MILIKCEIRKPPNYSLEIYNDFTTSLIHPTTNQLELNSNNLNIFDKTIIEIL